MYKKFEDVKKSLNIDDKNNGDDDEVEERKS